MLEIHTLTILRSPYNAVTSWKSDNFYKDLTVISICVAICVNVKSSAG